MKLKILLPILVLFLGSVDLNCQKSTPEATAALFEEIQEEAQLYIEFQDEIEKLKPLFDKKMAIKQAMADSNFAYVIDQFDRDTQLLDFYIQDADTTAQKYKYQEIRLIYKNNKLVESAYLYYHAYFNFMKNDRILAEEYLTKLITKYPMSTKINQAVYMLGRIYMDSDRFKEYLDLFYKFMSNPNDEELFWYGCASMENEEYFKADNIFLSLIDRNIGYLERCQIMLAINSAFTTNPKTSIEKLAVFPDSSRYHEQILLALGRNYAIINDWQNAFIYYNKYLDLNTQKTDAIKYEIAYMAYLNDKFDIAQRYIDQLLQDSLDYQNYTEAQNLLISLRNKQENSAESNRLVSAYQNSFSYLPDIIKSKKKMLQDYSNQINQFLISKDPAEKKQIFENLSFITNSMNLINKDFLKRNPNLNPIQIVEIVEIEKEILYFNKQLLEIDSLVAIIRLLPFPIKPELIESRIRDLDTLAVKTMTLNYLLKAKSVTTFNYDQAESIAREINELERMNDRLINFKKGYPFQAAVEDFGFEEKTRTNNEGLERLRQLGLEIFGNEQTENDSLCLATLNSIRQMRSVYLNMVDYQMKNYNKNLAAKYENQNVENAQANTEIAQLYQNKTDELLMLIESISQNYQLAEIRGLYDLVLEKDRLFEELKSQSESENPDQKMVK